MSWVDDIVKNEQAFKAIFDNARNLAVCGLVFAAAQYEWSHVAPAGFFRWFDVALVCVLYGVGWVLYWINLNHGLYKLREAAVPRWVRALLGGLYFVVAGEVISFILKSKI